MRLDRRRLLWLIPTLLALHNAEEAWTFGRDWRGFRSRVAHFSGMSLAEGPRPIWIALAVVTAVSFLLMAWVVRRPEDSRRLWLALLLQAVVLLNVVSHLISAAVLKGYAPGLVTAVAVNLPFSVYLLRRARQENWVSRGVLWMLVPASLCVHGPLLFVLLWWSGVIKQVA